MMAQFNFLVVDDSPTMRQLISFSLKRIRNAKVVEAGNGLEALKKMVENNFHLMVLDINMPLMDGLKLLSIIRQDPKHKNLPVIIVTTEGADVDRDKGIRLGANAYLPKPIQTNEFLKTIKNLLNIPN
jgi:two-component system, chemotaxis family, chemotaxis protein CheY